MGKNSSFQAEIVTEISCSITQYTLWPVFCAVQFLQLCIFKTAPGTMLHKVECTSLEVKSHLAVTKRESEMACALQFLGSRRGNALPLLTGEQVRYSIIVFGI